MKTVISCSRRTDILAFYYDWLQNVLKEKQVKLSNPYNNKEYIVDLRPENIHSIVLWSKDYRRLIQNPGLLDNYNLYFQFTITGYPKILEPNTISPEEAIEQIKALAKIYSPQQINWRFDPIILGKDKPLTETIEDRLNIFEYLCNEMQKAKIERCTTSFVTTYGHVKQRMKEKYKYVNPSEKLQVGIIKRMVQIAENYNMRIYACSSPIIEAVEGVRKAHCIDGNLLTEIFGEKASKANDTGQRLACGCTKSKDIGAYKQKCKHKCLYCYSTKA